MNNICSGKALMERLEEAAKKVFTLDEAMAILRAPRKNTLDILNNLARRKLICTLTRGLYALWPATERKHGLTPLKIIDPLMSYHKMPYYIGLLSAADHYGAAHQKPQVLQVIIPGRITLRKASKLRIDFHVFGHFPSHGITRVKHPFGYVPYSSPELTALDLLYFTSASGQFNNVCLVIRDMMPALKSRSLKAVIEKYPINASIQRLGFLLEKFGAGQQLMAPLNRWMKINGPRPATLASAYPRRGPINRNWKIVLNADVEVEY